jgi:hypothetical protein
MTKNTNKTSKPTIKKVAFIPGKGQKFPNLKVIVPSNTRRANPISRKNIGKTKRLGLLEDTISTGLSVADTIVSTFENPIDGLLNKAPNSILKVADMASKVVTSLQPNRSNIQITGPVVEGSKEDKFIQRLKEDIPIVQVSQIPSSFSADYTPAPLTIKDAMFNKTPCIRVNGSVIIEQVSMGTVPGLVNNRRGFLNPGVANLGTLLSNLCGQYQRHLWLNTALFYIPQCPTTYNGNVCITWQNSPNVTYTPTTNITELSQRSQFIQGHVNKGLTLPLKGDHKQLYNWFSGVTSDLKFYSDWSYEWYTIGSAFTTSTPVGFMGMTFDLLLMSRIEHPTIGLDYFPSNFIHYLSVMSGFTKHKCLEICDRMVDKMNVFEEGDNSSLELQLNLDAIAVQMKSLVKTRTFDKVILFNNLLSLMGWESYLVDHPCRRFLSSLMDIIGIRIYDLVLLSRVDPTLDLMSTILSYIVENQEQLIDDLDSLLTL